MLRSSPIIFPRRLYYADLMSKLGGAGDRFGDYLSCQSGHNQFTNTKFNRPIIKMSKSTHETSVGKRRRRDGGGGKVMGRGEVTHAITLM